MTLESGRSSKLSCFASAGMTAVSGFALAPLAQAWLLQKPPRIKVDGKRTQLLSLKGGARTSLRYQVTFQFRGYYQIGPLLLETGDLFGLHRRYRVVTSPVFVLVYPHVVPVSGYDVSSRRPIGEIKLVSSGARPL